MNGVVKVAEPVNRLENVSSFTILGDPGCDGLGVEIMTTFAKAMNCAHTDFKIILGDLVPFGQEEFYRHISEIINEVSQNPVYTLCGNHDTVHYDRYFGLRNYLLVQDNLLIVVLDNSRRKFEEETLAFLRSSLENHRRPNILILFHIPPPTRVSANSLSAAEWERLKAVMAPYRRDIRYILSGHVHSFFEAEVDGYRVVVSGGGGARLDFFGGLPDKAHSFHHVLRFFFDSAGQLQYEFVSLADVAYDRETGNEKVRAFLADAFQHEAAAHIRYQFFADDAYEKGLLGLETLFRALSKSAFYHAKNYFSVLDKLGCVAGHLRESLELERAHLDALIAQSLPATAAAHSPLAGYAFHEAVEAKKLNIGLLPEALAAHAAGQDLALGTYYVCTSCGNMRRSDEPPDHCHICGAPPDKIIKTTPRGGPV